MFANLKRHLMNAVRFMDHVLFDAPRTYDLGLGHYDSVDLRGLPTASPDGQVNFEDFSRETYPTPRDFEQAQAQFIRERQIGEHKLQPNFRKAFDVALNPWGREEWPFTDLDCLRYLSDRPAMDYEHDKIDAIREFYHDRRMPLPVEVRMPSTDAWNDAVDHVIEQMMRTDIHDPAFEHYLDSAKRMVEAEREAIYAELRKIDPNEPRLPENANKGLRDNPKPAKQRHLRVVKPSPDFKVNDSGATVVEYAVLAAILAVIVITALHFVGLGIGHAFSVIP